MYLVTTAVCNNDRLGVKKDYRKNYWRHHMVRRCTVAHLCDLDFADDNALIDETRASMQLTTSILEEESSKVGLFINPDKCKVMTTSTWYDRMDKSGSRNEKDARGLEGQ